MLLSLFEDIEHEIKKKKRNEDLVLCFPDTLQRTMAKMDGSVHIYIISFFATIKLLFLSIVHYKKRLLSEIRLVRWNAYDRKIQWLEKGFVEKRHKCSYHF